MADAASKASSGGGAASRYPGARNAEFRRVVVTGAQGKVRGRLHPHASARPAAEVRKCVCARRPCLSKGRHYCMWRLGWGPGRPGLPRGVRWQAVGGGGDGRCPRGVRHTGRNGPVELPAGGPDRRRRGLLYDWCAGATPLRIRHALSALFEHRLCVRACVRVCVACSAIPARCCCAHRRHPGQ